MTSSHQSLLASLLSCALCLASDLEAVPVLSELMADNATTLQDEDGNFTDWIGFYNSDSTHPATGAPLSATLDKTAIDNTDGTPSR